MQFTEYNHRNTKLFCFYFFSQNDDVVFVLQQQYYCTDESRRLQDKPTSTELQYFDQQDSQVSCLWTFCQLPIFIFRTTWFTNFSFFFFSKIRCYKTKRSHFTMFLVWLDRDKCTFCVHKRIIVFFFLNWDEINNDIKTLNIIKISYLFVVPTLRL